MHNNAMMETGRCVENLYCFFSNVVILGLKNVPLIWFVNSRLRLKKKCSFCEKMGTIMNVRFGRKGGDGVDEIISIIYYTCISSSNVPGCHVHSWSPVSHCLFVASEIILMAQHKALVTPLLMHWITAIDMRMVSATAAFSEVPESNKHMVEGMSLPDAHVEAHGHDASSNGNIFALLALCEGIHWTPAQRPVTRIFDVFFDLRLNKRLSKNREVELWLRRHHAHYDVTLMLSQTLWSYALLGWLGLRNLQDVS